MEITDLKELKKLMAGSISESFEFVEKNNVGSIEKDFVVSYNWKQSNTYGVADRKTTYAISNVVQSADQDN